MPPSNNQELGDAVRKAREAKGLSQRQLGKVSGLTYSAISRIESGQRAAPDAASLQKLARALDIDAEDFYALAGYLIPEGLPELAPYMRAKYDLPDEAAGELARYFARLKKRYGAEANPKKTNGGSRGDTAR